MPISEPVSPDLFDPQHGRGWRWVSGGALLLLSSCGIVGAATLARSSDALPTAPAALVADELDPERPAPPREHDRRTAAVTVGPTPLRRASHVAEAALVADFGGAAPTARATGLGGLPFVPFGQKRGEWLGALRLGLWPAERAPTRDPAYANPAGFYVVTDELRRHAVSPHFTLGEFAMREGMRGPSGESYVVLDESLVRKLEGVLAELAGAGLPAGDLRILSAFRAPSYNARVEGAAQSSRHQFGDAADVVVDSDSDGRMDDLNRDGRTDRADVMLVAAAVERVERRSPELVGGLGLYEATGPSGPFLHIDVRGRAARWGTVRSAAPRPAPAWRPLPVAAADAPVERSGRPTCRAEGAMAVLCARGR